jgi:hypothetical protein
MSKRIRSVGNRRDYPRELWGPRDREREREESDAIGAPLPFAPGGPPPPLKFRLFAEPIVGGTYSQAVDELVARYTGRRR